MEEQQQKIDFSYINEFGSETRLIKTFNGYEDQSELDLLLEFFKSFMISAGWHPDTIDKIDYIDE